MFNISLLRAGFQKLIGIRQSSYPQVPEIQAPLSESETGIYVQDINALMETGNIWYAAPDFNPNNWNIWISGSSYVIGNIVNYSGILYKCKLAVASSTNPSSDNTHWDVYYPFQEWLKVKFNQAITNLFFKIRKKKELANMSKPLMERRQLYSGYGNINKKIVKSGRFLGFEIKLQSAEGLLVFIEQVGIQATEMQSDFRFYLYHTTKNTPLIEPDGWSYDIEEVNSFTWQDLRDGATPSMFNCSLQYMRENTQGAYIFGYYEEDLDGQAIGKEWDCSSTPCFGCSGDDLYLYNIWSQFITLRNVEVPASALNSDRTLFDTSKIIYNNITNWGLNLSISSRCDLTNTILLNKESYADAFAHQLTYEFLDAMAKNSRINPFNTQIQTQARADMDVKFPGAWINQYNESIDAINIDLSGFNKACLCKDNQKKMKWSSPV